ncbi:helix-turn-helix domain-containing protein [Silanimonas sp.]|uniref:helix-turn-helix domain-containing protein n=1 Tax=Silanimonas sp. TaxID=1929290 RepID=UPI0037CA9DD8
MLLTALAGACTAFASLLAVALVTAPSRMVVPWSARIGGAVMLAGLTLTAWQHVGLAALGTTEAPPWAYGAGLFAQSWGFYALLSGVLQPADRRRGLVTAGGALSFALAALVPPVWAIPVSLTIGSAYALHLGALVYRLRATRRWFRVELPVVLAFAVMGLGVGVAGALTPRAIPWDLFALAYSVQMAAGFLLVSALLLLVPDLATKTQEAVSTSYAQSSLGRVDVAQATERLRRLFEDEHLYRDEDLGLAKLARRVDLSPHQLSELLNVRFGESFSKFVRRHRVAAASRMLIDEPRASVLSVGLSVGFGSQSTFYAAFKEETGLVPGEFRRRNLPSDHSGNVQVVD